MQFYKFESFESPHVAALATGRRIARLRWHSLLAPCVGRHEWERIDQLLEVIRSSGKLLEILNVSHFEQQFDSLHKERFVYLQSEPIDDLFPGDAKDDFFDSSYGRYVTFLKDGFMAFVEFVNGRLSTKQRCLLETGMRLEEISCPEDVYQNVNLILRYNEWSFASEDSLDGEAVDRLIPGYTEWLFASEDSLDGEAVDRGPRREIRIGGIPLSHATLTRFAAAANAANLPSSLIDELSLQRASNLEAEVKRHYDRIVDWLSPRQEDDQLEERLESFDLRIDGQGRLQRGKLKTVITGKPLMVLRILARNSNETTTYAAFYQVAKNKKCLEKQASRLREVLEPLGLYVQTVRNVGFRLVELTSV